MLPCSRLVAGCLVSIALFTACGCPSSGPDVELGKVTGTVTLDGNKLNAGRVIFFNVSGYSETADIKPDGRYEVQTAVGETDVFINHREPDIQPPEGRPGMPMPGKNLVPDKYSDSKTSGLKLTVNKGDNAFDIEMVTPSK